VTSRPELTSGHTDIQTYRHPAKEEFPYLVKSETSLASLAQSKSSIKVVVVGQIAHGFEDLCGKRLCSWARPIGGR